MLRGTLTSALDVEAEFCMAAKTIVLCAGLQSSGSTLASWCFLQRPDMDGVLDAPFDSIPDIPPTSTPLTWCKFTIACFRFADVQQHLEDEGWNFRPLLITRDVRAVFNSLVHKKYGRNGTTADDPPLRLRLRRFHRDWKLFHDHQWPILRYEDLIQNPVESLVKTCRALDIPWTDAMLHWPKPPHEIAAAGNGNATFAHTRGANLLDSINPALAEVKTSAIPLADLDWMEREFADMNEALGYPLNLPRKAIAPCPERAVPNFQCTRRHSQLRRLRRLKLRRQVFAGLTTAALSALILADAKDWIRCIDFF